MWLRVMTVTAQFIDADYTTVAPRAHIRVRAAPEWCELTSPASDRAASKGASPTSATVARAAVERPEPRSGPSPALNSSVRIGLIQLEPVPKDSSPARPTKPSKAALPCMKSGTALFKRLIE